VELISGTGSVFLPFSADEDMPGDFVNIWVSPSSASHTKMINETKSPAIHYPDTERSASMIACHEEKREKIVGRT
jgi:hypothetical protein